MTQIFDDNGFVNPVTAVQLLPSKVSAIKTIETDGYNAVQVEYGEKNKKKKEFRVENVDTELNKEIDIKNLFSKGDVVKVIAVAKGKGFAGAVKRHGFKGGPRTHGQKHNERQVGAIGSGVRARVPKGQKMPGRMGGQQVTIKGTKVMGVDTETGLVLLKGAIPGRRGTVVEIQSI